MGNKPTSTKTKTKTLSESLNSIHRQNDASFTGQVRNNTNNIMDVIDVPQKSLIYGATALTRGYKNAKFELPSNIMKNDWELNNIFLNTAADLILDPLNFIPSSRVSKMKNVPKSTKGYKIINGIKILDNIDDVNNNFSVDPESFKYTQTTKQSSNMNKKKYGGYVKIDDAFYKELGLGDWLGKAAVDGATSAASGSVVPGIGTAIGAVAGIGSSLIQSAISNKKNSEAADSLEKKEYLNKLNTRLETEYMAKGGFINYTKGAKHSDPIGGIPVDSTGNPSATSKRNPSAVVEKGEITYIFPDGKSLVLSEKLGDVKKFNKIKNSYKSRLGKDLQGNDTISKGGFLKEMNILAEEITARNKSKTSDDDLPNYWGGGPLQDTPLLDYMNRFDPLPIPSVNKYNIGTGSYSESPKATLDYISGFNPKISTKIYPRLGPLDLSSYGSEKTNSSVSTKSRPLVTGNVNASDMPSPFLPKATIPKISSEALNSSVDNDVEQGELYNPMTGAAITAGIGGAATTLGNLALANAYKEPEPVSPKLVNAPTVSYEAGRQSSRKQGIIARNAGLSSVRNSGLTKGGMAANAANITTGVQRNLNDNLSNSYMTEENTNKQLKFSADQSNAQSINQSNQFNSYRKDQYNYNKLPFYQGALGSIQGVANDLSSAKNMRDYLGINASRTGYEVRRNPVTKKLEMIPVKGFFERMNKVQ